MAPELQTLCEALDSVASAIKVHRSDDVILAETTGQWNCAPLSANQLIEIPARLSDAISAEDITTISEEDIITIKGVTLSINKLLPTIVPHLLNGNVLPAMSPYLATMNYATLALTPILGWKTIKNRHSFPAAIASRIQSAEQRIQSLEPNLEKIEDQAAKINQAYQAAEELPTTLDELNKANVQIAKITKDATLSFDSISNSDELSKELLRQMNDFLTEAEKLVANCSEAYRAATSIGLAASFDERARKLNNSIRLWSTGLAVALVATAGIGYLRLDFLHQIISDPNQSWSILLTRIFISLLGVAPCIWFAWLATKQIGQRFKMAEDYAFKASVAKAYEGYRREAARIDPKFEAYLFQSAMCRVDESPLRLVDKHSPGSPWGDALSSRLFTSAVDLAQGASESVMKRIKPPLAKPALDEAAK